MKKGKFVYKNQSDLQRMHDFYDKTLADLNVPFSEDYFETSFGKTHSLVVGNPKKPKLCTIHGGNGITTLNLRVFRPLLAEFCIIAPDVIGMPGKSDPYRNISSSKDEYGTWIKEVLDFYRIEKISFAVSSYSSAMLLSFAKSFPQSIDKAVLLVPSGIAHGPILPMITKMVVKFIKYYSHPDENTLNQVLEVMGGKSEPVWREFFNIMMSSYKMELRPPKEYSKKEMCNFNSSLFIIASDSDIFFPASRVFKKAAKIFSGKIKQMKIESNHLPSEEVMNEVCKEIVEFLS